MFNIGLSGCNIQTKGNVVTKWTIGKDSSSNLKYQCNKQKNELRENNLFPLKTVPIISECTKEDYYSFDMLLINSCVNNADISMRYKIANSIMQSLTNRSKIKSSGFKSKINHQMKVIKDNSLRADLLDVCEPMIYDLMVLMETVSDYYPVGYAHGDFGIDNMLLDENGNVCMIDFAYSFIHSPLIDVVTLLFSLNSDHINKDLYFIKDEAVDLFIKYEKHIKIIQLIKIIEFASKSENLKGIYKLYESI